MVMYPLFSCYGDISPESVCSFLFTCVFTYISVIILFLQCVCQNITREDQVVKLRESTRDLFDHCFQVNQGGVHMHTCMCCVCTLSSFLVHLKVYQAVQGQSYLRMWYVHACTLNRI